MSRKVITFLGKDPRDAVYEWQGKSYPAKVMAQAIRQFAEFDQMLVFVTPLAKTGTFPILVELQDDRIRPVDIVDGKDTESMWQVFQTVVDNVQEGETVIFDITHGFRSLPFLAFLFIAYLKSAKNVTIEAIYYGAWEMQKDGITPVLDLTEFISLLDWITATNRFVETGDGRPLADLLQEEIPPGLQRRDDLGARALGINLRLASSAIENISLALRTARPLEAMQASHKLVSTIQQTQQQVVQQARPFEVLVDQITAQYGQFGLEHPLQPENLIANLRHQLGMIRWYLDHGQTIQAAALAREWVVSLLARHFGLALLDRGERAALEQALNNAVELHKPNPRPATLGALDARYAALPQCGDLTALWSQLTEVRNDLAHVGMRENAQSADRLKLKVESLYPALKQLATVLLDQQMEE